MLEAEIDSSDKLTMALLIDRFEGIEAVQVPPAHRHVIS